MAEMKTLALPNVTGENLSRKDMLQWVNSTLSSKYAKIEDLCSGVAYCQLMERIFPNSIGLRKVKTNAKFDYDFTFNLKLLQGAFVKLKFDKNIPIDKLVKGRFQDNFEFLQWFKRFYDMHSNEKENDKSPHVIKPIRKAISASNLKVDSCLNQFNGQSRKSITPTSSPSIEPLKVKSSSTSYLTPQSSQPNRPISPSSLEVLTETCKELKDQSGTIENEKTFYFRKLQQIENLCIECEKKNEFPEWTKKILGVLYETGEETTSSPKI